MLYLIAADGRSGTTLGVVDRPGAWFGTPTKVGDTVVVPEVRGGGPGTGTLALLHLRIN